MNKSVFDDRQLVTPEGHNGEYQSIAFLVTSVTATNAISNAQAVLLFATQDCHVRFSKLAVAAVATDTFIPANIIIPMTISTGNFIAAIRDSADGTLHISPVE